MCLESTIISINLKIKTNMEYIDKRKINMKYIDKIREGKRTYAYSKARNSLKYKLFYSLATLGKKNWYNLGKNMINRKHICALNPQSSPLKF